MLIVESTYLGGATLLAQRRGPCKFSYNVESLHTKQRSESGSEQKIEANLEVNTEAGNESERTEQGERKGRKNSPNKTGRRI